MACPLPYPERFHAAVDYVVKPPAGAPPASCDLIAVMTFTPVLSP